MPHRLSDADREKFRRLEETLSDVDQDESTDRGTPVTFGPFDPMLAIPHGGRLEELDEGTWIAERKYDGTRLVVEHLDDRVGLFTRRHVERSETLPEMAEAVRESIPGGTMLDAEYTYLDPDGVSQFVPIHTDDERKRAESLEPTLFVFDVMAVDGEWVVREPLIDRKERLDRVVDENEAITVVDHATGDFRSFYDELVASGEEGIVVKRRESPYHEGTRSDHWRKVKSFSEVDAVVVGYTPGEGKRRETFGALVLTDGEQFIGRVGTGYSDQDLDALLEEMQPTDTRPVPVDVVGKPYSPVRPFVATIKYQEVTHNDELRAPVFLRRRPNRSPSSVRPLSDQTSP